ncbi:unnamed protein product [Rhizopus stolonifer]
MTTSNLHNTISLLETRPLPLVSGQQMRPRATLPTNYNHDMNAYENNNREFQCNIHPQLGLAGDKITVVFYGHLNEPVRLSFNQLVLPTERKDVQGMISLLAEIPAFYKTRPVSNTIQLYLTFMKKDNPDIPIRQQYIGNFTYKDTQRQACVNYNPPVSSSFSASMDYSPLPSNLTHISFSYQQQPINTAMAPPFSPSGRENTFIETQQPYGGFYRNDLGAINSINHQRVSENPYYNSSQPLELNTYSTSMSHATPNVSRAETQLMQHMTLTHRPNAMSLLNTNSSDYHNAWGAFNQGNDFSSPIASHQNLPLECNQLTLHPTSHHVDRRSPYRRVSRNLRGYGKAPIDFNSISLDDYSPYPDIVSPIHFNVLGNITSMLLNWSIEENRNRRRLVRLSRQIDHYGINCLFETTHENASPKPETMTVSCIEWPGKDTYWITSVDCINLAEFLLGTRFDVDYKNCIRRNLEGFGPTTVSKTKPDSVDFFKVIMGFNHPKPRNIEKDIKVFQWHVLPFALKKIIIKFKSEKI